MKIDIDELKLMLQEVMQQEPNSEKGLLALKTKIQQKEMEYKKEQEIFNTKLQKWVADGIVKAVDGFSASKKDIMELLTKEVLTEDDEADLRFNLNIMLSCLND